MVGRCIFVSTCKITSSGRFCSNGIKEWYISSMIWYISAFTTHLFDIYCSLRPSITESLITSMMVWAKHKLWYLRSNFCWGWICCCFFQNLSLYLPVFYCKIFSILIIFLRWLQVVLVICCSRFTRFTNELYIIFDDGFCQYQLFFQI